MVIVRPSENPLFVSHPDLRKHYDRFEYEALRNSGWLWQSLDDETACDDERGPVLADARSGLWNRMHYHGLARFFTETACCLAYFQALVRAGICDQGTLLFHGNSVALRIVVCWDRIGYVLNEVFNLDVDQDKVYFDPAVAGLLGSRGIGEANLERAKKLKALFDGQRGVRQWRNRYCHRAGEYFKFGRTSGGIVEEWFPWSLQEKTLMVQELAEVLPKAFASLKAAMKICSEYTA